MVSPEGITWTFRERNYHPYLVLKNGKGPKTEKTNIPYKTFEQVLLMWLTELHIGPAKAADPREALEDEQADLERRIAAAEADYEEAVGTPAAKSIRKVMDKLGAELEEVIAKLETAEAPPQDHLAAARSLIQQLQECPAVEREALRMHLRQQIRGLVKSITVLQIVGKQHSSEKTYHLRIELARGVVFELAYTTDKSGKVVSHGVGGEGDEEALHRLARRGDEMVARKGKQAGEVHFGFTIKHDDEGE